MYIAFMCTARQQLSCCCFSTALHVSVLLCCVCCGCMRLPLLLSVPAWHCHAAWCGHVSALTNQHQWQVMPAVPIPPGVIVLCQKIRVRLLDNMYKRCVRSPD